MPHAKNLEPIYCTKKKISKPFFIIVQIRNFSVYWTGLYFTKCWFSIFRKPTLWYKNVPSWLISEDVSINTKRSRKMRTNILLNFNWFHLINWRSLYATQINKNRKEEKKAWVDLLCFVYSFLLYAHDLTTPCFN